MDAVWGATKGPGIVGGIRATSTPVCELCGSSLYQDGCPVCGLEVRRRFLALRPGEFPATALPPAELTHGPGLIGLRRALAKGEWGVAEELWDGLLRTVQPLGPEGRKLLADCFEAYACLKEALGKTEEAQRFRHRALSARKDPSSLNRRDPSSAGHGGWDSHAWVSRQSWDMEKPSPEVLSKVRAELEHAEVVGRRRKFVLTLSASGLAALWCATFMGLPTGPMALVGIGVGWLWARW